MQLLSLVCSSVVLSLMVLMAQVNPRHGALPDYFLRAAEISSMTAIMRTADEPVPQPTVLPHLSNAEINERRLGCRVAAPEGIATYAFVLVEKPKFNDADTPFQQVQSTLHDSLGIFNAVDDHQISISIPTPITSTVIAHTPSYFVTLNGHISYLIAHGCNHEYLGLEPYVDSLRLGVNASLVAANAPQIYAYQEAIGGKILDTLVKYCGSHIVEKSYNTTVKCK